MDVENVTGVDTSNLTFKRDFIALKAELEELDINKLVNVPINLNNLRAKVYDLDVDTFNSVPAPVDLKKKKKSEVAGKQERKKINKKKKKK